MKNYLLFTPGPVTVADNIQTAILNGDICHREPDFDVLLQGIERKLLSVFEIQEKARYRAVVITGSGTAANEAILSSAVGDRNILVLSNGEFGDRLHAISAIHNPNTHYLEFPWATQIDVSAVAAYMAANSIDVIAMVHHETCAGMLNPIKAIGAIAKAHGAIFIVDCVSSAGADAINIEECNIAFCSSSSSKAIGSYPGLSVVIGRTDEFEKLKHNRAKTTYLNLATHYNFLKTRSQTPNTPAVQLFYALNQALENILAEGTTKRHATIKRRAGMLRQGMLRLNLKFLIDQKDMSSVLTTVLVPLFADVGTIRRKLREESIIIYEGKGVLKDRVFQVGNIGEMSDDSIRFFLSALKSTLDEMRPIERSLHLPTLPPIHLDLPAIAPLGLAANAP